MNRPEILAPGGSIDSIFAAVNAGCDAIYMGGKHFGARAFADNPGDTELLNVIDDIHLCGKKVYLTVNTVLCENEFKGLYNYIDVVYRQGVDAVIVQDLGVLRFINREFPGLDIHASTQMSIVDAMEADLLMPYGVTRVVPARELSFNEISMMRKNTTAEIEVFVHGALCCSYSGQCLMSSLIGGRSGNRGACAQPCRKQYIYEDGKPAYELSLKDLCTLEYIPELVKSGIDSFKIEGRMKKPEYVALTTHMYKKYLDYYYEMGHDKYKQFVAESNEYASDIMQLKDIYNRGGFTAGYLVNNVDKRYMMTENRPNHEGVIVGKVSSLGNKQSGKAVISFCEDVYAQDILEIRNANGETVHEYTLKEGCNKGKTLIIKTGYNYNKIIKDNTVYRIRNNRLIDSIQSSFPDTMRLVKINGKFSAHIGGNVKLEISIAGAQNYSCTVTGGVVQAAAKHPASECDVRNKVMVTGESEFEWTSFDVDIDEHIFLATSELKSIRREAMVRLRETVNNSFRRQCINNVSDIEMYDISQTQDDMIITECRNKMQFDILNTNEFIDSIYLHIEDMEEKEVKVLLSKTNKSVYLVLPRIFRIEVREKFEETFDLCSFNSFSSFAGVIVCNLTQLAWLRKMNKDINIRTSDNLYVRNNEALRMYKELGAESCSSSVEMTDNEIDRINDRCTDVLVYGRPTAMIMANLFNHTGRLKDSYGNTYYIIIHEQIGYSEILHYEVIDRIDKLNSDSTHRLRLSFTTENSQEIKNVLDRMFK